MQIKGFKNQTSQLLSHHLYLILLQIFSPQTLHFETSLSLSGEKANFMVNHPFNKSE